MANGLSLATHISLLGAEITVGIDLHLDAAIAEDAFRNDGHHIDALNLGGDDERRWLVIRIGGARAEPGNKVLTRCQHLARPGLAALHKRHQFVRTAGDQQGIKAIELTADIGVTVTGADLAFPDAAQHRAGVAADDLVIRFRHGFPPRLFSSASMAARSRCGRAGAWVSRTPVAWRMAPNIAGAVGIKPGSPTPFAP